MKWKKKCEAKKDCENMPRFYCYIHEMQYCNECFDKHRDPAHRAKYYVRGSVNKDCYSLTSMETEAQTNE